MGTEVSSPAEAGVGVAARVTLTTGVPVPWVFSSVLDPVKGQVGVFEPDMWLS